MKLWTLVFAGLATATAITAAHADCGDNGSPTPLVLQDWSAVVGENGRLKLTIVYENTGAVGVKMAEATVWFRDALGRSIGGARINPDPKLPPGSIATEEMNMVGLDRLGTVDKADVTADLCSEMVLYDDGTKERF